MWTYCTFLRGYAETPDQAIAAEVARLGLSSVEEAEQAMQRAVAEAHAIAERWAAIHDQLHTLPHLFLH